MNRDRATRIASWGLLAGTLLACRRGSSPEGAPDASAASASARAAAPALTGEITTEGAVKGRLLVAYRTAEEQRAVTEGRAGLELVRAMIERWEVKGEVDFGATPRVPFRIEGAPAGATPVAVLDVEQNFWNASMGRGAGRQGDGPAGGGVIVLKASPPRPPRPEPCAGERRRLFTVEAPGLPASPRRFCAWLPASWEAQPGRRYPMVWMFPGLFSTDTSYLRGKQHVGERFDAVAAELGREVILVGVDTSAPEGSTYLPEAWDAFLTTKALPTLVRELHARPERTAHAVIGQSTGGFNALSYGLRHPELFSAIGASSPDPPDFEPWLFEPGTQRAREWIRRWLVLESAVGGPGQMRSWAAAWSPGPAGALDARWPFDPSTGLVSPEVLARWVASSPHGLLASPARAEQIRSLRGRIAITAGRHDEFGLFEPAERFARELNERGLEATFQPTDTGHGGEDERLTWLLRVLVPKLDAATP